MASPQRSSTTKITKRCSCPAAYDADRQRVPCPRLREARHGSWTFVVDLGTGPDGRRRQVRRGGFATKAAAEVELTRLKSSRDDSTYTDARGVTVAGYLTGWLDRKMSAGDLRPTTARSYRQHLEGCLVPHLGRLPLGDLRVHHVDAMLYAIRKANATSCRPVGPATQRRIVATLRSALSDAVQGRLLSWNPASHAKIGKATRPKVDPWSTTEVGAFLDAVADERDAALWHLAVFSGLRRGELCGLRWSDVELEATRIVVREQATQVGHSVVYGPPKTASGERVVDLDDVTVAVLRAHRAAQAAERLAWGPAYADSGRVFTRENGEALHPETVTRRFARLVAAAGLRRVRLHDLRHGFASLALAAGVPLAVISKRLGHSSIAITSDTYSHLLEGMGKAAAEQVAGLVRRPMPAAALLRAVSDPL